jgi:hypothetical protein
LSSSPRTAERKSASATDAPKIPFAKRLPGMSDHQLNAYQATANRISRDAEHPKNATAIRSIPMIEAEIRRRADGLGPTPVEDARK